MILTRAAEPEALGAFREFIERISKRFGIPSETAFALKLACDEAASNVIQHGYAGMNPGSMMLELRPQSQRVIMTLSDFGHPFEPVPPNAAPNVDAILENQPGVGFGLYIIYQMMDEVSYFSDEQGNHLVMVRDFSVQVRAGG